MESQLGADHPSTATNLNNLANLYLSKGSYEKAEPLLKRSLQIREQQLGKDHPDTAVSLNNLAVLYFNQNRLGEAEQLIAQSLSIRLKVLGENHPTTQSSIQNLSNLVKVALEQDRTAELSDHLLTRRILLQLRKQNPGSSSVDIANENPH